MDLINFTCNLTKHLIPFYIKIKIILHLTSRYFLQLQIKFIKKYSEKKYFYFKGNQSIINIASPYEKNLYFSSTAIL
jgi:hypothetical protein